jgi:hypothetical protein
MDVVVEATGIVEVRATRGKAMSRSGVELAQDSLAVSLRRLQETWTSNHGQRDKEKHMKVAPDAVPALFTAP